MRRRKKRAWVWTEADVLGIPSSSTTSRRLRRGGTSGHAGVLPAIGRIGLLVAVLVTLLQTSAAHAALSKDPLIVPLGTPYSEGPWQAGSGFVYGITFTRRDVNNVNQISLVHVDKDGQELWRVPDIGIFPQSVASSSDGTVYVAGTGSYSDNYAGGTTHFDIKSISQTGSVATLHSWDIHGDNGPMAFGHDGELYVYHGGGNCRQLQRVDRSTGEPTTVSEDQPALPCDAIASFAASDEGLFAAYYSGVSAFFPYADLAHPTIVDNQTRDTYFNQVNVGSDGSVHMLSHPNQGPYTCERVTLSRHTSNGVTYKRSLADFTAVDSQCVPVALIGRPDGSSVAILDRGAGDHLDLLEVSPTGEPGRSSSLRPPPQLPNSGFFYSYRDWRAVAYTGGNIALLMDVTTPDPSSNPPNNCGSTHLYVIRPDLSTSVGRSIGSTACPSRYSDQVSTSGELVQADGLVATTVTVGTQAAFVLMSTPTMAGTLPPPVVTELAIAPPSPKDALLTRSLTITGEAASGGLPPAIFQYGWSQDSGSPPTSLQSYTVEGPGGRLDYQLAAPDQDWYLFARAVDANGNIGGWYTQPIHTPKAPILVALGDSVTSGHHRDYGEHTTVCHDPNYGFPAYVAINLHRELLGAWATSFVYSNLAESGYSTEAVITGKRRDACGTRVTSSPLLNAKNLLRANAGSWNRVVISAGIDDTNWSTILQRVIVNAHSHEFYTARGCSRDVSHWNGWNARTARTTTQYIGQIRSALESADGSAQINWIFYYNVAGTGSNGGLIRQALPAVCEQPVNKALDQLANTIRGGLDSRTHQIDSDSVMHMRDDRVQPLFVRNLNNPGWPHPNRDGAQAIASLI